MSFQQGLSGLNSSSKGLDVVSNNIANANTVGFKSAETHFADVFANSLSGGGAAQAGIGVTTAAVVQQFSQGNITSTNNPLDISINGGGFYRMSNSGNVTYSRNGQFHLDKDGYIVDDRARRLTGYLAQNGLIVRSTPADLQLSSANIDPVATGSSVGGAFTGVKASLNLDSRSAVPTTPFAFTPGASGIGGTIDPTSYNFSTSTSIYDSLGNAHTMSMYAVRTLGALTAVDTAAVDAASTANAAAANAVNLANAAIVAAAGAAAVPPTVTAAEAAAAAAAATTAATAATNAGTAATTAAAVAGVSASYAAAATSAATAATSAATFATSLAPADGATASTAATAAAAALSALPSQWDVYTSIDGTDPDYVNGGTPVRLSFNSSGQLVNAPSNGTPIVIDLNAVVNGTGGTNIATTPLLFNLDFAGTTQFGAANGVNSLQQDGYTSGRLTGVSVSADGTIRGNYSNGQSKDLAQVALANFTNPNGLASLGGNQWAETSTSGPALVGAPNTGTLGVLQSAAVEESNVDLTAELVKMITQQRNYQANAQSIKTQDQIMQTLVNLR